MSSKNRITTKVQVYILPLWLLLGTSQAVAQPAGQAESLAAWAKIQSVLQHPRCLNCHQSESPTAGEFAPRSYPACGPRVGESRRQRDEMRDVSQRNGQKPDFGNSGAPRWQLAPISMLWQGLSGGDLCRSLKDPAKNGNRSLEEITTHSAHRQSWCCGAGSRSGTRSCVFGT